MTAGKEIYSLPFRVTIETKIREFQYKLLDNIVFTMKNCLGYVNCAKEKRNPLNI